MDAVPRPSSPTSCAGGDVKKEMREGWLCAMAGAGSVRGRKVERG